MDKYKKILACEDLQKIGEWNGYEVYEPVYNEIVAIGLPQYILKNDKEIRLSDYHESFTLLDKFEEVY